MKSDQSKYIPEKQDFIAKAISSVLFFRFLLYYCVTVKLFWIIRVRGLRDRVSGFR